MSSDWYDHDRDEWKAKQLCTKVLKPYADRLPPKDETYWPDFNTYLLSRGLSPEVAKANQWYRSVNAGAQEPRIVIPASSDQLDNHFWQARVMDGVATWHTPIRYQRSEEHTSELQSQSNLV